MKVKYQGGPMKGQYQEIQTNYTDRVLVTVPEPVDYRKVLESRADTLTYEPMKIRRGEYARSHKQLKNGAVIYIWMGWIK